MEAMFPATFPSGQGSDFAGRVVETGPGVTGFAPGDEVMGWSDRRSAQADHVLSDPRHLIAKPPALDWIRAGALWAIGVTSFSAVRAVAIRAGDVVAVSGAAGGVGGLAAQLARRAGGDRSPSVQLLPMPGRGSRRLADRALAWHGCDVLYRRGVFDRSHNHPPKPSRRLVIEATFTV